MTVKNRVLLGLALICGVLSLCFWPEREEDAFSSDVFRQAEEVTAAETEMMAPDEVLQSAKGDVHLQALYNKRPVCLFFWASWSSGSLRQLEVLESLYSQYGQDIYFLAIPVGPDTEHSRTYYQGSGGSLSLYEGNRQMLKDYGIHQVPQLVLIRRGGQMLRPFSDVLTARQLAYELEKIK